MLCVKSCLQPLQWQGFPYLPRDMSTHSPHCEICPDFPSLNSSLLNCAPLLTAFSLWTTTNNSSGTHILFLASHTSQFHSLTLDETAWRETMEKGLHKCSELELGQHQSHLPHPSPSLIHHSLPFPTLACTEPIWLYFPITQFFQNIILCLNRNVKFLEGYTRVVSDGGFWEREGCRGKKIFLLLIPFTFFTVYI